MEFTIPGTPVAKGRPRFARRGKFVKVYSPDTTASFEVLVKLCYLNEHGAKRAITGKCSVTIRALFPIPKSMKRADKLLAEEELLPMLKKPDVDNIIKSVLDGLNGAAYEDDKLVYKVACSKVYSPNPRTEVEIEER